MNLVVFNMSNYLDWEQGVANRNFFIVKELIKRPEIDQVVLVDFLAIQSVKKIFGFKRTWGYAKDIIKSGKGRPARKGQRMGLTHSLTKLESGSFYNTIKPVYLFQGLGLIQSADSSLKKLGAFLDTLGFNKENTLLWSYNAFLPEAFEMQACYKVFDAVDNWANHASYKKEAGKLIENYKKIDRMAQRVFTVSSGLTDLFNNAPAFWVPNGIDLDVFAKEIKGARGKGGNLGEQLNVSKPIIGYIGTIQERLDFDLIKAACLAHPDKSFVFIGPVWSGVENKVNALLDEVANVHFLGRKPYSEIPNLLKQVDVAIIPHQLDAFIHSTNPMKMYDYLAAGRPVVTTPGAGTEMFKDVLYIRNDSEGFIKAISEALEADSVQDQQRRQQAVAPHAWKNRVADMMATINQFC